MEQTYVTLNNGAQIPQFGLGVFQIAGDDATKQACLDALKLGYRHIDTAHDGAGLSGSSRGTAAV